jgi:hypothetical protein
MLPRPLSEKMRSDESPQGCRHPVMRKQELGKAPRHDPQCHGRAVEERESASPGHPCLVRAVPKDDTFETGWGPHVIDTL